MLRWVNENPRLLPDYELEVIWQDGACTPRKADRVIFQNWYDRKFFPWGEPVRTGPGVVGLLGPGCSGPCMSMALPAWYYRMPMISNTASRPILSNRALFPGFWRTMFPDAYFNEAWLSLVRSLGFAQIAVVTGERTERWDSMTTPLLGVAKRLGVRLRGPAMPPKFGDGMRGWELRKPSIEDAEHIVDAILDLKPGPPRFMVMLTAGAYGKVLLCAVQRRRATGITILTFGWMGEFWWRFGLEDLPCDAEDLEVAANRTFTAAAPVQRPDSTMALTCAPDHTADEFVHALHREVAHNRISGSSSTADAVCTFALLLHELIYGHGATAKDLERYDEALFMKAQDILAATSFQGVQSHMKFAPGTGDPDVHVMLEQIQNGAFNREREKTPLAWYREGKFHWTGEPIWLPDGKIARAGAGTVTEFAEPRFSYGKEGPLEDFKVCKQGETLDAADNNCKGCPSNSVFIAGSRTCQQCALLLRGNCISTALMLYGAGLVALLMVLPGVYVYLVAMLKRADSMWVLEAWDLVFAEPPEVLGRGSFGLVLRAEYRGTSVAVKRVAPSDRRRNGGSSGRAGVTPAALTDSQAADAGSSAAARGGGAGGRNDLGAGRASRDEEEGGISAAGPDFTLPHFGGGCDWLQSLRPHGGRVILSGPSATSVGRRAAKRAATVTLKREFVKEMRWLSRLRHPCVTTVIGAVVCGSEPMLVMELMDHGSLHDLLHNETFVIEGELAKPIFQDILQGLLFLHASKPMIVHCNLKAANVLVDGGFRAKIASFGLSQKQRLGVGSPQHWMAPELLRGAACTPASDVYAFGHILREVYTGEDLSHEQVLAEVVAAMADSGQPKPPDIPEACTPEIAVLMRDCWHTNPRLRPSTAELDRRLQSIGVSAATPHSCHRGSGRGRTRNLLYELFPRHVADALREGRKVAPESRDVVTIFFSDIVGFTNIASALEPRKVSCLLDRLYTKFDQLSRDFEVFKVETIGDAYMAVANLVEDQPEDHARRVALFAARAIQAASETWVDMDSPDMGCVSIRVGLHSGPVLASVVGTRNLRYCLIGDTVNTASRMESTSERNRIHCSGEAARLLQQQAPDVKVLRRGVLEIKDKGEMETFWVDVDEAAMSHAA